MTKIYRGNQLEEVGEIIQQEEAVIYDKYKMIGNIEARLNTRNVSLPFHEAHPTDDILYEYMIDDKVMAIIYSRRNSFNTADLYIVHFEN